MRVFVLGGTGALGSCTLPALVEAGHEVAALTRTPEKAAWVAVFGRRDSYMSSILVEDGADAVVAALAAPAGVYNVVDDEPLTKLEYASALAAAAGTRPWVRGPGRLALLLGDRLTSLARSLRVSNRRFRQTTGWQTR